MVRILAVIMLAISAMAHPAMEVTAGFARAKAAKASREPGPLTFTFVDAVPESITLGASYAGPKTPSAALYDPGDGKWRTYTSKTIKLRGKYIRFAGDWRRAYNGYYSFFEGTFATHACVVSGRLEYDANGILSGYRQVFSGCAAIIEYADNPFQPISGPPANYMFHSTFQNNSSVTSYPAHDGFMDTSGIAGPPTPQMFYATFQNNSSLTSYPTHDGFMDTSGLSGPPANYMFSQTFQGNSNLTAYPTHDGFMDTSGLSGPPANYMFASTFRDNSSVTSYPSHDGFMDTSGITGSPATSMFYATFQNNSSVTSYPSHDGFMDTSGIAGPPTFQMFRATFYNNSSVTNAFVLKLGEGIEFDASNLDTLHQMFQNSGKWTGTVMWGDQKIYEAFPEPLTRIQTFYNCTSMPDYDTLHPNWK